MEDERREAEERSRDEIVQKIIERNRYVYEIVEKKIKKNSI